MTERKIVIFGIGIFAEKIYRYLSIEGIKVISFTVEKDYCNKELLHDIPVIPYEELGKYYSKNNIEILVCIGYNQMNQLRERIFKMLKDDGYNIAHYIHPQATILTDDFGEGNIVLENASIGIWCRIGDGNIFYNNAVICHNVRINSFNYFSPSSTVLGEVTIFNGCFFGGNSTIKNGITIDDYCLIGTNAFVRDNISKYKVIVPTKSKELDLNSLSFVDKLMK